MHPAVHVLISLMIGLGIGLHHRYRYAIIMVTAFLVNGIIDMDYILFFRGLFTQRYFHTGIFLLYIPALILVGAYLYERDTDRSIMTRISLLVLLISASHLLLDTFSPEDTVYLYYPFSMTVYRLDQSLIPFIAVIFTAVVLLVNRIETYLFDSNENKKDGSDIIPRGATIIQDYSERLNKIKAVK